MRDEEAQVENERPQRYGQHAALVWPGRGLGDAARLSTMSEGDGDALRRRRGTACAVRDDEQQSSSRRGKRSLEPCCFSMPSTIFVRL